MTTSGNVYFNVTANDILTESLGLVGVYSPGESIDASESTDALRTLNMMLKAAQWRAGLWLHRELFLFPQKSTSEYLLGLTGDHCAESAVKTEVATAASSGATSIVIDSTTGFTDTFDRDGIVTATTPAGAGAITLTGALVSSGIATLSGERKIIIYSDADDSGVVFGITGKDSNDVSRTETITGPNTTTVYSTYTYKTISSITIDGAGTGNIEIGQVGNPVGIELDDGTLQWTYIGGALSTTLSLVDSLTDDIAADNHVYSYVTQTARPIEIIEARIRRASGYDTPLIVNGRLDYTLLSNKSQVGTPNQIYYDKQLVSGKMKIWPVTDNVQEYIVMSARVPVQAIINITDTFEFAAEWFEAIAWNLALRLFSKYGKPIDPEFKSMARSMVDSALAYDSENASNYIQIANR